MYLYTSNQDSSDFAPLGKKIRSGKMIPLFKARITTKVVEKEMHSYLGTTLW